MGWSGTRKAMKKTVFLVIIGFLMLSGMSVTMALSPFDIYLSTRVIHQGELSLIRIHVESRETPLVSWMGEKVHLVSNPEKTEWIGFLGVDLTTGPGRKDVVVKMSDSGPEQRVNMEVREKDYGVRNLTLPKNMVDLDSDTLQRVKKESRVIKSLWEAPPSNPRWNGFFLRPVSGEVKGPFGQKHYQLV